MVKNKKLTESGALAAIAVKGIQEKQGKDILCLNLKGVKNAICDYFIICHATSTPQVEAIVSSVEKEILESSGQKPWFCEGMENAQWVLMDYIDVVVHVFQESARSYYDLESLWADAEIIKYPSK